MNPSMNPRRYPSDAAAYIRSRVTARAAAERYGLEPNRAGYIRCPFHQERTPSCKLYEGEGGFHCFGCGRGGTVIDLVMGLFGLDFRQALVRLDLDFSIGAIGEGPALPPPERPADRRGELVREIEALCKEHRRLYRNRQQYAPSGPDTEMFHPLYAEAVQKLPETEWRIEELENDLRRMEHAAGGAS